MNTNNKQGQGGILGYFFVLGVFILIWALFLASFFNTFGQQAITANNLTGLEAFIWGNLNLFVTLGVLVAGAGGVFFAGGQQ